MALSLSPPFSVRGHSKGLITVKLYDNIIAMIKGIEKNQFAGMNYSVVGTLASCLFLLFMHAYPFAGILFGPLWARVLCGFSIIIVFASYNYASKYIDVSLKHALIHPISALLHLWAILNSMIKILSKGGIDWRGTFYPLKELRQRNL